MELRKFAGKRTCQTWNFNGREPRELGFLGSSLHPGNRPAADAALAAACIDRKVLVSKNVCHRAPGRPRRWQMSLPRLSTTAASTKPSALRGTVPWASGAGRSHCALELRLRGCCREVVLGHGGVPARGG